MKCLKLRADHPVWSGVFVGEWTPKERIEYNNYRKRLIKAAREKCKRLEVEREYWLEEKKRKARELKDAYAKRRAVDLMCRGKGPWKCIVPIDYKSDIEILNSLSWVEQVVLEERFTGSRSTYAEIGKMIGTNRTYPPMIEQRALRKLRKKIFEENLV